MPLLPAAADMVDPQKVQKENLKLIHRDIDLIQELLQKYSRWEHIPPMWMTYEEIIEYRKIEEEFSGIVLRLLEDEVTLDPRYLNRGNWCVVDTLLDLIRKGLAVK
jgi:uncharacterized metal-binding protein